jgi:VIT1/CCC1 family predicted Fe2+/Mn2+ transporter
MDSNVQIEIDTAYLYKVLADHEQDPIISKVFLEMSNIEGSHAQSFAEKKGARFVLPGPSWRAKTLHTIGKIFGYGYLLGVLMETETSLAKSVLMQKKKHQLPRTGSEENHVKILRGILERQPNVSPTQFTRFEKRHRSIGGNAIRAAVLGGNDGLVSNFSLIMGVAGASAGNKEILMAGLAGLLAGALSMALGEWISVKSSQELYENQMSLEMEEIEMNPEGEKKEIALIYMAKGIPEAQALEMASKLMEDKHQAHAFLIKEELGIQHEELEGSTWEAAIFSFIFFAVGAIIPLAPVMLFKDPNMILYGCVGFSSVGLFLIGSAITLFTNKNVWYSGFRQVIFGLAAAAVTFGIGKIIGVSITG